MNFFTKINSLENTTSAEKQIINFLKQNPIELNHMSVDEIADRCFVSKASIYRLCEKLGYSGLNEMKLRIIASLPDKIVQENTDVDFSRPFRKEDSDFMVLSTIKELYEQTINHSLTYLSMEELQYTISLLKSAKNIFIFVEEENRNIAEIFKNRIRMLGINIELLESDVMKLSVAQTSKIKDVALYVTSNPKLKSHQRYFKILNGNRTKIILVSSPTNEVIVKMATHHLIVNPGEQLAPEITNFSNNLVFSFIFDVIYSLFFKEDYDMNLENMKNLFMKRESME